MTAEPEGRASGARPRALQAPPADLGAFLFAPVWVEADGTALTTLSALARAELDPWDEARRLAAMRRLDAAVILARSLATLPDAPVPLPRARIIAARLVALLPAHGKADPPLAPPEQTGRREIRHRAIVLTVASVTAGLALLLAGHLAAPDHGAMAGPPLAAAAEVR